jgi:isopenicillin N synthase-like dioxygenase
MRLKLALEDTRAFFALPEAVKRAYVSGLGGQRGYVPFATENAKGASQKDLKEFWHVGRELPPEHHLRDVMPDNVWPTEIERFKTSAIWLYSALDELGSRVLEALAVFLELPRNQFSDSIRDGNSILRLLHYPPVQDGAPGVRAAAHEDINVITLLLGAEEAGLEVRDRDGRWLPINPPPGALVCNIGDMLQRASNHRLPSTTHRVVNPAPERAGFSRYSTPFFLHYRPDFLIETLPTCSDERTPNRYPHPITAHQYLMERLGEIGLLQR